MNAPISHVIFGGDFDGHCVVVGIENVGGEFDVTVISRRAGFLGATVTIAVPADRDGDVRPWEAQLITRTRAHGRARCDRAWAVAINYLEANRDIVKDLVLRCRAVEPARADSPSWS